MPSIADLYSTIDSYKRRAADVLSDPQNSLMQMLGYANDRSREYNENLAQSLGVERAKLRGQQPTLADLNADKYIAEEMANSVIGGMTTWHGSPHTFNKFDLSKIGTGEGAQAYGHGLYLAENPKVAKEYRNVLTGNHNLDQFNPTVNGEIIDTPVVKAIIRNGGNPEQFIKDMQPKLKALENKLSQANKDELLPGISDYDMAKMDLDRHQSMVNEASKYIGKNVKNEPLGNLYKVDLPDKHIEKMLDWDKPLSQQPKNVQKAFNSIIKDSSLLDEDTLKGLKSNPDPTGKSFYNQLSMSDKIGHPSEASNILNKLDVPGIKYLDEQSRGAGEGTRNFVIFDPNIAKIEERNSIPIPQDPHAPNYLEDVHKALSFKFEYPREEAFKIAQENAALPVSEGGLGLPKDNTPEMRAKAMGYETPMYHGTNEDIEVFNTKGKGKTAGAGAFFTTNPTTAETYVSSSGGGNILPVMVKKNDLLNVNARGKNWSDIYTNQLGAKSGKIKYSPEELGLDLNSATTTDELGMIAADLGKKGIEIKNVKDLGPNSHVMRAKEYLLNKYGIVPDEIWSNVTGKQFDESQKAMKKFYESQKSDIVALQDPSMIRSKFAAFDPKQMGNPDLLAGVLPLSIGGAALGTSNDDVHSPNYLENLHKKLAQKPVDTTDVHFPNYLEDIHNQLANQQ